MKENKVKVIIVIIGLAVVASIYLYFLFFTALIFKEAKAEADATWEVWSDSIADNGWGEYDSTGDTMSPSSFRLVFIEKVLDTWRDVPISSLGCSLFISYDLIKPGDTQFIRLYTWDSSGKQYFLTVKIRYGDDVDAIVERGFDDLRARIRRKPRRSHLDPGLEDFPGILR